MKWSTIALSFVLDAALVLLFAGLGRSSHSEAGTISGLLHTAWPFLAGLTISWIVAFVWKRPLALLRAGIPVWIGTVALGMILRVVAGGTAAVPFIIVASVSLLVFLVGWRGIAALIRRLRRTA